MSNQSLLHDLTLLAAAAVIGWWAHGANNAVQARPSASKAAETEHNDPNLAFQYGGLGPDGQLTLYNPASRTLYVYPSVGRSGNSHITCLYSVRVDRAGAPLERENCPNGSFLGH